MYDTCLGLPWSCLVVPNAPVLNSVEVPNAPVLNSLEVLNITRILRLNENEDRSLE